MKKGRTTSVRFSDTVSNKIDQLVQVENNLNEKLGYGKVSRNEVIEKAIEHYYLYKMDQSAGGDFLNTIKLAIDDSLKHSLMMWDASFNALLKNSELTKEALMTVLKISDNSIPYDAVEDIVFQKRSRFQSALEKKVQDNLQDKKG